MMAAGTIRKMQEVLQLKEGKERKKLETKLFREERKIALYAIGVSKKQHWEGLSIGFVLSKCTENWLQSVGYKAELVSYAGQNETKILV